MAGRIVSKRSQSPAMVRKQKRRSQTSYVHAFPLCMKYAYHLDDVSVHHALRVP